MVLHTSILVTQAFLCTEVSNDAIGVNNKAIIKTLVTRVRIFRFFSLKIPIDKCGVVGGESSRFFIFNVPTLIYAQQEIVPGKLSKWK